MINAMQPEMIIHRFLCGMLLLKEKNGAHDAHATLKIRWKCVYHLVCVVFFVSSLVKFFFPCLSYRHTSGLLIVERTTNWWSKKVIPAFVSHQKHWARKTGAEFIIFALSANELRIWRGEKVNRVKKNGKNGKENDEK